MSPHFCDVALFLESASSEVLIKLARAFNNRFQSTFWKNLTALLHHILIMLLLRIGLCRESAFEMAVKVLNYEGRSYKLSLKRECSDCD